MRKLVTIRRIREIKPIEGADAIELAVVDGWQTVVKKNEYAVGDLAVYLEVDSWVPHTLAPFLSKGKEPREFNGVKGERLRTMKLRGALSQGLLLPLEPTCDNIESRLFDGLDVTFPMNIQKWERPVPAQLAGQVKGNFPTLIPKTDQERIQNLVEEVRAARDSGLLFEVTEKLEGSSMTVYRIQGEFGVCSRNLDLKRDENNSFWATAIAEDIEAQMMAVDPYWDFAIQGELIGPGIQGNIYNLTKPQFYVFDVYDIRNGRYLNPTERRDLVTGMGLNHVPVVAFEKDLGTGEVDYILSWAEDKSVLNPKQQREGIVFKQMDGGMTFKAISNVYLLGEK
jgi:RNA ligase (TIGR02306 family)